MWLRLSFQVQIIAEKDTGVGCGLKEFLPVFFTLEYFMRARQAGAYYLKSGAGFIDLIAVLPFWLGFFLPESWLGLVRSMRVLRLLKLYRYSKAMRVFLKALVGTKRHLGGMFLIVFIIMLFGAVGIHEIEKDAQPEQFNSLRNCIWWTVVTLMTVGYGDMYPITTMGKVFAEVLMVLGLALPQLLLELLVLVSISKCRT